MSIRLSFVIVAALLAGACARTELLYGNADWLTQRWAGGLLDASRTQHAAWRDDFSAVLEQHRQDLLPELNGLLTAIQAEAETGLRADRLWCLVDAADDLYRAHARLFTPLATRVLLDISPAQIDHLAGELEQRNRDYAEDYLQPDLQRRERRRIERYTERIERWTGDLSTAQLRLVQQAVAAMPDVAGDWLDYRLQQQQRLLAILRSGSEPERLQRFLDAWWVDLADRPAALVRKTMQLRRQGIELALALDAQAGPEERAVFTGRLADLREQLQAAGDRTGSGLPARPMMLCAGPAAPTATHAGR